MLSDYRFSREKGCQQFKERVSRSNISLMNTVFGCFVFGLVDAAGG